VLSGSKTERYQVTQLLSYLPPLHRVALSPIITKSTSLYVIPDSDETAVNINRFMHYGVYGLLETTKHRDVGDETG
jgi:hypothetical protein